MALGGLGTDSRMDMEKQISGPEEDKNSTQSGPGMEATTTPQPRIVHKTTKRIFAQDVSTCSSVISTESIL